MRSSFFQTTATMKNLKNKTLSDKNKSPVPKNEQEPYEIIYADPRDEEIHLKFLKRSQISAHMARWFLDQEYNQLIWSDGIFELLEIDPKNYGASYNHFLEVVHPEDRKLKNQAQENLKKTTKPIELNYRLLFNDGRIKWINEICSTDFDKEGNPIRSYGTIQDITKYKISQEKFRQKEERYKSLIESIPSGIAICQNNKFAFLNPAGSKMLGGDLAMPLKGTPISKIVSTDSRKNFLKKIRSVVLGNQEPVFQEKMVRLDGSFFDAEITLIHTLYQGLPAVQLIINDITERLSIEQILKENENRLKELIQTKDKFFSIIAHDLRSPFNSILGFIDVLEKQYDDFDDDERKEYLRLIEENASLTYKLLNNLLDWSMAQTGKIIYRPGKVKLFPVVESVVRTLQPASNLKKINLIISVPGDMEIIADSNMLSTVFQNLISNAIKYSFAGGEVLISAEVRNNQTYITVSDTGTGMNEVTKSKLFRIDEQASIPGTADEKGSGLGLILCKDFIEKHNGEISVESEQGKGSRFIFRIPQQ